MSTHDRLPDLIVDPRMLRDWFVSNDKGAPAPDTFASDCEGLYNRCLRVSVATSNVGEGDIWLVAPYPNPNPPLPSPVTQRIFTKAAPDLTFKAVSLPNTGFVYDGQHKHFHFKNWTVVRLRPTTDLCRSDGLNIGCASTVSMSKKVSFCLEDYRYDTSPQTAPIYEGHLVPRQNYIGCQTLIDSGTKLQQGISAGRSDTYRNITTGQLISLDGIPNGDYMLEAEVNPDRTVQESDYSNNITRIRITIGPSSPIGPGPNPRPVTGGSAP